MGRSSDSDRIQNQCTRCHSKQWI